MVEQRKAAPTRLPGSPAPRILRPERDRGPPALAAGIAMGRHRHHEANLIGECGDTG